MREDPQLRRCCYRVAPPPADAAGDDAGDDEGVIYYLMDEVGSRVRTVSAAGFEALRTAADEKPQQGHGGREEVEEIGTKQEAAGARAARIEKLSEESAEPEPEPQQQQQQQQQQLEPPVTVEGADQTTEEGAPTRATETARVEMALLHHLNEGVMYSVLWLQEDAPAGAELVRVLT